MKKTLVMAAVLSVLSLPVFAQSAPATAPATAPAAPAAPAKQMFSFDFADVCLGAGLSGATAYTPTAGTVSPVLVFLKDSEAGNYSMRSGQVPKDWEHTYQEVEKTQLVACLTVKSREKVKDCPFDIEGATYTAELNNTVYDFVLYEAKTGKEVLKQSFDQKAGQCPMFKMFSKKVEVEDAPYKEALTKAIKASVQP